MRYLWILSAYWRRFQGFYEWRGGQRGMQVKASPVRIICIWILNCTCKLLWKWCWWPTMDILWQDIIWIVSWVEFKHPKLGVGQNIFHNLSLLWQLDAWHLILGAYFAQLYFASLVQHPTKQFGRSDVLPLNCEGSWSSQVRRGVRPIVNIFLAPAS